MEQITLNFTANEQALTNTTKEIVASDTVNFIRAVFELGTGWQGFDSVRAVWKAKGATISTVLDNTGAVTVPTEVLAEVSPVLVNLIGSTVENNVVTDRLTTFPALALRVTAKALINGSETAEITPSQFEQYVAQVGQLIRTNALHFTDAGAGNILITRGE